MDYQSMNYDFFSHALKPKSVMDETDKWRKIRSYVYVIRKKFQPYQIAETASERKKKLNTKLNLFKMLKHAQKTKIPQPLDSCQNLRKFLRLLATLPGFAMAELLRA